MAKFSERIGKVQPKTVFQIDWIDNDLRNKLWNVMFENFFSKFTYRYSHGDFTSRMESSFFYPMVKAIWHELFKLPLDEIPINSEIAILYFRNYFFNSNYLEVYDLIDYVVINQRIFNGFGLEEPLNYVLEKELSGYRFVNGMLTPIIDKTEIQAIEDAIQNTTDKHLQNVHFHLEAALQNLAERNNPDYRTSVKESISAIEAIAQLITGKTTATLGNLTQTLEKKINLHGSFKEALNKMYGYTSDAAGIRHALHDETTIYQEDAIFMLVSCSAFVNYLIKKVDRAGIQLTTPS